MPTICQTTVHSLREAIDADSARRCVGIDNRVVLVDREAMDADDDFRMILDASGQREDWNTSGDVWFLGVHMRAAVRNDRPDELTSGGIIRDRENDEIATEVRNQLAFQRPDNSDYGRDYGFLRFGGLWIDADNERYIASQLCTEIGHGLRSIDAECKSDLRTFDDGYDRETVYAREIARADWHYRHRGILFVARVNSDGRRSMHWYLVA